MTHVANPEYCADVLPPITATEQEELIAFFANSNHIHAWHDTADGPRTPFIIADCSPGVEKDPRFHRGLAMLLDIDPSEDDTRALEWGTEDHWGYGDEHTTCGNCGQLLTADPYSMGHYSTAWVNGDAGEITCGDCVTEHWPEDYIEWIIDKTAGGEDHDCYLVDPTAHGFRAVLYDIKYSDLATVAKWAVESKLELVYIDRDAYFRIPASEEDRLDKWGDYSHTAELDARTPTAEELQSIKSALVRREVPRWGEKPPTTLIRCAAEIVWPSTRPVSVGI